MPEDKKKELASKSLVVARQASDEDQDLRFTDSGVYGEGVEPCQDTRVADGSRPTRGLVQTRSRWRGWMMGGYGPSERAVAVDPLWVAAPGMSCNGFGGHAGRARARQPMRRRSRHGV